MGSPHCSQQPPPPRQSNLPWQQKGVCELPSQAMSLLCSEPSLAPTSLGEKACVLPLDSHLLALSRNLP